MCMCMCTFISVGTCICVSVCLYTCMCVCVNVAVHVCIHVCVYVIVCIWISVCFCVCVHSYVCVRKILYIYLCICVFYVYVCILKFVPRCAHEFPYVFVYVWVYTYGQVCFNYMYLHLFMHVFVLMNLSRLYVLVCAYVYSVIVYVYVRTYVGLLCTWVYVRVNAKVLNMCLCVLPILHISVFGVFHTWGSHHPFQWVFPYERYLHFMERSICFCSSRFHSWGWPQRLPLPPLRGSEVDAKFDERHYLRWSSNISIQSPPISWSTMILQFEYNPISC